MIEIPKIIAIDHDDYHAEYVGKTIDGRQFFLAEPFVPQSPTEPGREFVALFVFAADGSLLEAQIDDFGPRPTDNKARAELCEKRLAELGEVIFDRIEIAPFSIEKFGITFGLIPDEDEDGHLTMILQPGDFMAFSEPWDSGDYDT